MIRGAKPADQRESERLRARVYLALEGGPAAGVVGGAIEAGLIILILANVVAYTLQSVPSIAQRWQGALSAFETVSVAIFTVEYALRLWTVREDPAFAEGGALTSRVRAALRPMMVIDFFAIAPAYVALFVPFVDLRVLRLVRLLRLLKIARYSPALSTLAQVIIEERRALVGTLLLLLTVMLFAAAAMHAIEGGVQPAFSTVPNAMWWAVETLTTVGYGDVVPITPLGRVVGGMVMIIGLGLFALPVGIIATGFVDSMHRREFVVTFGMLARVPLFRGFDAQTIAELMNLLRAQAVRAGAVISAEGERAAAMYFVVSGEVEARLPDRTLRFGAGDFFGELALLHDVMRAATIVATTSSRLLALSSDDFDNLLRHHPKAKEQIGRMAHARAHEIAEAGGITQAEIESARKAREEARWPQE